jgi:hypothetical protein
MQTQSDHSLPHNNKARLVLFCLLIGLSLVSCSRKEVSLVHLETSVAHIIDLSDGSETQTLNLAFLLDGTTEAVQVRVQSSDQQNEWVSSAESDVQGLYQISPLAMGKDVGLPQGLWNLSILQKDGRTLNETFTVSVEPFSVKLPDYDKQNRVLTINQSPAVLLQYDKDGKLLSRSDQKQPVSIPLDALAEQAVLSYTDDSILIDIPL